MASTIQTPYEHGDFGLLVPFFTVSLADQTTDTAAQNCGVPCRYFWALISIKTYVVGNASTGPAFKLQASSVVGMTNPVVMGNLTGDNTASGTETQSYLMRGVLAVASLQYVQVKCTLNGTATIAFDCIIDAVQ